LSNTGGTHMGVTQVVHNNSSSTCNIDTLLSMSRNRLQLLLLFTPLTECSPTYQEGQLSKKRGCLPAALCATVYGCLRPHQRSGVWRAAQPCKQAAPRQQARPVSGQH
jgi:hypothetical protein